MIDKINTSGLRIKRMPSLTLFTGDAENNVSPIEQFYSVAVDLFCVRGGRVFVNVKKVCICPQDAELLYALLRHYMYEQAREAGTRKAAQIWEQLKPTELREVPEQYVFIESGCIYLKDDRIVAPPVAH